MIQLVYTYVLYVAMFSNVMNEISLKIIKIIVWKYIGKVNELWTKSGLFFNLIRMQYPVYRSFDLTSDDRK